MRGGVHPGGPGPVAVLRRGGTIGPPAGCSPLHGRPGFGDRGAAIRLDVAATACQRAHEPAVGAHGHSPVPAADRAGAVRRAAVHSPLAARDQRCENQRRPSHGGPQHPRHNGVSNNQRVDGPDGTLPSPAWDPDQDRRSCSGPRLATVRRHRHSLQYPGHYRRRTLPGGGVHPRPASKPARGLTADGPGRSED